MNKTISLLDLPSGILEKIILQVSDPKDLCLHPFINIAYNFSGVLQKKLCVNPDRCRKSRSDTDFIHRFNILKGKNPQYNVLPGTLCILSRVSKGMYNEINNNIIYWKNTFVRDCRQGKPYKYDCNYKLKYLQKIYKYYSTLSINLHEFKNIRSKFLTCKVNNADIYLKKIRLICLRPSIDNPKKRYRIYNLERLMCWNGNFTLVIDAHGEWQKFESIVNSRKKCLEEIIIIHKVISESTSKLHKIEHILNGLKMQGCK